MKRIFISLLFVGYLAALCQCKSQNETTEPNIKTADWSAFKYPEVDFTNEDLQAKGATYAEYVPNPEKMIRETALRVCQQLYESTVKIPDVKQIVYRVYDYDGISGKGGEPPVVHISFSSDYLDQQIKAGSTKDYIVDEIVGVLVHEMTHAYQQSCKYEGDGWSVIEGIADAVRYLEGYIDISQRKSGGHWTDGYKTTGFFIVWVMQNKDQDFLKKLNTSVGQQYDWKWEDNFDSIVGKSLESVWEEYQDDLISEG